MTLDLENQSGNSPCIPVLVPHVTTQAVTKYSSSEKRTSGEEEGERDGVRRRGEEEDGGGEGGWEAEGWRGLVVQNGALQCLHEPQSWERFAWLLASCRELCADLAPSSWQLRPRLRYTSNDMTPLHAAHASLRSERFLNGIKGEHVDNKA